MRKLSSAFSSRGKSVFQAKYFKADTASVLRSGNDSQYTRDAVQKITRDQRADIRITAGRLETRREITGGRMKRDGQEHRATVEISESDVRMVSQIRAITARGNNVEIRRKGDGYSILEVSKRHVEA